MQLPKESTKLPSGHIEQELAPAIDVDPVAQFKHESELLLPALGLNVLTGHFVQLVDPTEALYVPAGQLTLFPDAST